MKLANENDPSDVRYGSSADSRNAFSRADTRSE